MLVAVVSDNRGLVAVQRPALLAHGLADQRVRGLHDAPRGRGRLRRRPRRCCTAPRPGRGCSRSSPRRWTLAKAMSRAYWSLRSPRECEGLQKAPRAPDLRRTTWRGLPPISRPSAVTMGEGSPHVLPPSSEKAFRPSDSPRSPPSPQLGFAERQAVDRQVQVAYLAGYVVAQPLLEARGHGRPSWRAGRPARGAEWVVWGERRDLNPRSPGPQPGALTELGHAHREGTSDSSTGAATRSNSLRRLELPLNWRHRHSGRRLGLHSVVLNSGNDAGGNVILQIGKHLL